MQRHVHNALSLRLEAGTALTATAAAWTLPLKWVHWRGRLASPARSASSAHWAIAPAHQRCLAPAVWLIGNAPGIPQLQAGVVLFPDGLSWLLCDHQQAKLYHSSIRLAGKEASHTLCKPFCPGNFAASSLFLCFLDFPNSTGFCSCRRVQLSSRYDGGSVESSDRNLNALLAPGGAQHRLARLGSPLAPLIPGC